ncbi:MAG: gliding motility-associated C-terminal domain-containing protein [Janthinobacterium lividum]
MKNLLPARPLWTSALLLLLALLVRPALASHLLGGEMTYRYIDDSGPANTPLRYEVTLLIYHNCNNINTVNYADVGIYSRDTGAKLALTTANYSGALNGNARLPQISISSCQTPYVPPGCIIPGNSQTYQLQRLVAIINLPRNTQGYYAIWTSGNRNNDITNLLNPSGLYMSLYATLSPPTIFNRSPIFSNVAIALVCANDTTYYLNNAVDPDGDRLSYAFGQPYSLSALPTTFTPPLPVAPYNTIAGSGTFSANTPFGTGRGIVNHLDASTSVATLATPNIGKYVVAVDVQEYRTIGGVEQLIGVTRRDVQLVVAVCPASPAPRLPPPVATGGASIVLPRNYTIEAGTSVTIPILATAAPANINNPLTLTANSPLLDGPGGYDATLNGNSGTLAGLTGTATATGVGSVLGTFTYKAGCTDARTIPYDIAVTVEDKGCAGKTIFDVFRVTVTKPQGPTAIAGDAAACTSTTSTYTASGGTTPGLTWSVTGGTILGSNTANPVTVQWGPAGTGTLSLQGVSQGGCLTDVVTKNVAVSTAPALSFAGNRTICQGASTTITVSGAAPGATYTVTGGPVTGTGTTFVLTPTATTTYTIMAASTTSSCAGSGQITITVNPVAAPVAVPPVAICSGASAQLGSAPVAGNTYSWSPTTGLSNPAIANPTVTLTNTTSAATTQTYTLSVTNASGCASTTTTVVTVNPAVVATTAATVTTVTDAPVTIGAAPVAGFTYSWSPATGLSSSTLANPTVTLPNYTGIPITRTYTLTTTNTATGCVGTASVVVTVNPDLTFEVFNNVITANGDNLNDRLKVRNIKSFPNNKVEIYNRWGRQIFTTTNYDNDTNYWGTDPILVAGNYYYIFKQGDNTIAKGWIEVVR